MREPCEAADLIEVAFGVLGRRGVRFFEALRRRVGRRDHQRQVALLTRDVLGVR